MSKKLFCSTKTFVFMPKFRQFFGRMFFSGQILSLTFGFIAVLLTKINKNATETLLHFFKYLCDNSGEYICKKTFFGITL